MAAMILAGTTWKVTTQAVKESAVSWTPFVSRFGDGREANQSIGILVLNATQDIEGIDLLFGVDPVDSLFNDAHYYGVLGVLILLVATSTSSGGSTPV